MNIGTLLTKSARNYPDNLGIVHGDRRLTYLEFNSRTNRLANALGRLGIRQGDHIAVLQYNYPETLESIFAAFKAGCSAVPINFRLHSKEIAFIINNSEARAVILSPEFNDIILDIRSQLPKVDHLITLSGAKGALLDYETLLSAELDQFIDVDIHPDDTAWLFYTSGTTGRPKGAMLTHRNLLAMTMNFYADICPGFSSDDAALHAAPLSHGSGMYAIPNIAKGAANVILASKSFDPALVFETIEKNKITNMFAAPTMIKLLVESPSLGMYDISSLRALNYGGAPMLVEDLKNAIKKIGPCLVQLFGQTESPMTITGLPHRDHVLEGDVMQLERLASSGIERTDVEVRIADPNGVECSTGEVGEIVTRSDLVMKGYWRNEAATKAAIRNGWLYTGDMGYMDQQGYLFIMDRSKDMIISGGENVYPRETEEILITHPAVREVAVIGIPDPKWGEEVKAIVSLIKGASVTESELILFCRSNIAGYKTPKSIDFIDELPKNNYGKILKRELRNTYWKHQKRKV
ncbi:long-chain fatty acid--CoA ligase [bacterium]|nr:long-chain fatty acid--CoA ligase [bacterium]